jgi:hypothetical protein
MIGLAGSYTALMIAGALCSLLNSIFVILKTQHKKRFLNGPGLLLAYFVAALSSTFSIGFFFYGAVLINEELSPEKYHIKGKLGQWMLLFSVFSGLQIATFIGHMRESKAFLVDAENEDDQDEDLESSSTDEDEEEEYTNINNNNKSNRNSSRKSSNSRK